MFLLLALVSRSDHLASHLFMCYYRKLVLVSVVSLTPIVWAEHTSSRITDGYSACFVSLSCLFEIRV